MEVKNGRRMIAVPFSLRPPTYLDFFDNFTDKQTFINLLTKYGQNKMVVHVKQLSNDRLDTFCV